MKKLQPWYWRSIAIPGKSHGVGGERDNLDLNILIRTFLVKSKEKPLNILSGRFGKSYTQRYYLHILNWSQRSCEIDDFSQSPN